MFRLQEEEPTDDPLVDSHQRLPQNQQDPYFDLEVLSRAGQGMLGHCFSLFCSGILFNYWKNKECFVRLISKRYRKPAENPKNTQPLGCWATFSWTPLWHRVLESERHGGRWGFPGFKARLWRLSRLVNLCDIPKRNRSTRWMREPDLAILEVQDNE